MRYLQGTMLAALLGLVSTNLFANAETKSSVEFGAQVYQERCSLCHGSQGMGEGILPLNIKNYPSTNLRINPKHNSREELYDIIAHGAAIEGVSEFMPPMGNELSWTQLESVIDFVMFLRENSAEAMSLLAAVGGASDEASIKIGREIFVSRCSLCHGKYGEGDGRMAKVVKNPSPANLTKSMFPKEYIATIVDKGGAAVGRSPQMPPWGEQLNPKELSSVVSFVMTLRN